MDNLKKFLKSKRKGEEVNLPRYIKNLVYEMMQLDKLLNEYETKINDVTLEANNYLFKFEKNKTKNKQKEKRRDNELVSSTATNVQNLLGDMCFIPVKDKESSGGDYV